MRVEQLMLKDVVTIQEHDSVKALIRTMITHQIGGVPVVNSQNQLTGYVSDGDLLRAISPKQQTIYDLYSLISAVVVDMSKDKLSDLLNKQVSNFMKKRNLQTVDKDEDLDTVLKQLSHNHIKRIPIVDDQHRVIGLITRDQIIQHIGAQFLEE